MMKKLQTHFHFPGLDAQSCQTFVLRCHQGKHIDVQMLQGDDATVMCCKIFYINFVGPPFVLIVLKVHFHGEHIKP
jgi:hypothetical protein